MKLNAKTKEFLKAASFAAQSSKAKSTIPILEFLLVDPVENGVKIHGSDNETFSSCFCVADISDPEPFCVPSALFISLLSSASGEDIQITTEKGRVNIEIELMKTSLGSYPATEFPKIPEVTGVSFTMSPKNLSAHLDRVAWCASKDTLQRYNLCGVNFQTKNGFISMVATDGKNLAESREKSDLEFGFTLKSSMVPIVSSACEHCQPDVSISVSEKMVKFDFGGCEIIGSLINGSFPDWKGLVPVEKKIKTSISRKTFMEAMRRVKLFSNDMNFGATFEFNGALTITTQNAINSHQETIACTPCEPFRIRLNHESLLNIASRVGSDQVTIEALDHLSPVVITDGDFMALTMPLRIDKKV